MAFEELKQRQATMWGSGPFEKVADEIANIHEHLVAELQPREGEKWLDVATGTGAIAIRAARARADVTASDLSPGLIETAKQLAAGEGLQIEYDVADVEKLPYGNADFDVVSSSFGAIFAPDHSATAHELGRVTKPGGRLGLTAWRAEGGMGEFFGFIRQFQPPLPEGAGNMLDWGREEYAEELLGRDFDLRFVRGKDPQLGQSGEQIWQVYVSSYGPVKTLYDNLDESRREELHRAYVDFYEGHRSDGGIAAPREYTIILGMRR
jgi:ubiquinone/menaquinone biosynthesis C-methylase UbiE